METIKNQKKFCYQQFMELKVWKQPTQFLIVTGHINLTKHIAKVAYTEMMRLESFMLALLELNTIYFYINLNSVTENTKE